MGLGSRRCGQESPVWCGSLLSALASVGINGQMGEWRPEGVDRATAGVVWVSAAWAVLRYESEFIQRCERDDGEIEF